MRHAPFVVDRAAHDPLLRHTRVVVEELGLSEEHETTLWNYLTYAAASMINAPEFALHSPDSVHRTPISGHNPVKPASPSLTPPHPV